ncbi:MAG: hypothetical protein ACOCTU_04910 [Bacteroidota bacterium]
MGFIEDKDADKIDKVLNKVHISGFIRRSYGTDKETMRIIEKARILNLIKRASDGNYVFSTHGKEVFFECGGYKNYLFIRYLYPEIFQ